MDTEATVVIDKARWSVRVSDREIDVPHKEFLVLVFLAENAHRVVSRAELVNMMRQDREPLNERLVDTYVARLRKRLGASGCRLIRTVPKVGYRITATASADGPFWKVLPVRGEASAEL
jgi:DNA-binding response OmpR family regulator